MMRRLRSSRFTKPLSVLFAGLMYAIALKYFVFPSGVILTGSEGIAVSVSYYLDSATSFVILYALFQLVLLVFAYRKISRTFAIQSALVVVTVIAALLLLPEMSLTEHEQGVERVTLVLFGGILAGLAKAIAFRSRGSTGDEDIIAGYFATKHLRPVGSVAVIAGVVSTIFGLLMLAIKGEEFTVLVHTLMYTALFIFVSTETLNTLYHKFRITMIVTISDKPEAIGRAIREVSPHRTFTTQPGVGGQSARELTMLRTIITREELPTILDAIRRSAPDAFYYHHEVDGVSQKFYITPIG